MSFVFNMLIIRGIGFCKKRACMLVKKENPLFYNDKKGFESRFSLFLQI